MGKNINSVVSYGDFGQINSFTNTIGNKTDTISYTYDDFYRIKSRNLNGMEDSTEYTYLKGQNGQDTTLVESFNNSKETYSYEYDQYGNIISVYKEGILTEEYEYDDLNQLVWAKIGEDEYNYYYVGNSSNFEYVVKNGKYIIYGYDSSWRDRLISYDGKSISYDEIGNPLKWRNNMTFSWEYGRRLKTVTADGNDISYTYDADGLRTSKTVNGVKTEYYWLDGVLQGQKTGSEYIIFLYDENGTAYGMLINQNGVENYYYYLFNLQGDIVGIMDSNGATVAEYTYDAWGQLLTDQDTLANTIGGKNPLRYRGYYYDSETGFYYLKSRYYDPYVQRFINADGYVSTGTGIAGFNMYAYCDNNPIIHIDPDGENWFKNLIKRGKQLLNDISTWCNNNIAFNASAGIEEKTDFQYYYFATYEAGYGYSKGFENDKPVSLYANYEWHTGGSLGIDCDYENFNFNLELGTDISIGTQLGNISYDFGASQYGRIYMQQSIYVNDVYTYERFSINAAEIVGTVLVACYAPQYLPSIGYVIYRCYN